MKKLFIFYSIIASNILIKLNTLDYLKKSFSNAIGKQVVEIGLNFQGKNKKIEIKNTTNQKLNDILKNYENEYYKINTPDKNNIVLEDNKNKIIKNIFKNIIKNFNENKVNFKESDIGIAFLEAQKNIDYLRQYEHYYTNFLYHINSKEEINKAKELTKDQCKNIINFYDNIFTIIFPYFKNLITSINNQANSEENDIIKNLGRHVTELSGIKEEYDTQNQKLKENLISILNNEKINILNTLELISESFKKTKKLFINQSEKNNDEIKKNSHDIEEKKKKIQIKQQNKKLIIDTRDQLENIKIKFQNEKKLEEQLEDKLKEFENTSQLNYPKRNRLKKEIQNLKIKINNINEKINHRGGGSINEENKKKYDNLNEKIKLIEKEINDINQEIKLTESESSKKLSQNTKEEQIETILFNFINNIKNLIQLINTHLTISLFFEETNLKNIKDTIDKIKLDIKTIKDNLKITAKNKNIELSNIEDILNLLQFILSQNNNLREILFIIFLTNDNNNIKIEQIINIINESIPFTLTYENKKNSLLLLLNPLEDSLNKLDKIKKKEFQLINNLSNYFSIEILLDHINPNNEAEKTIIYEINKKISLAKKIDVDAQNTEKKSFIEKIKIIFQFLKKTFSFQKRNKIKEDNRKYSDEQDELSTTASINRDNIN